MDAFVSNKRGEAYALTDDDVRSIASNQFAPSGQRRAVVVTTHDHLVKIDRLRPDVVYVVLYQLESKTSGHWVSFFLRNEQTCVFFDSLGHPPDYDLRYQSDYSGSDKRPYLSEIISRNKYDLEVNTHPVQADDGENPHIET